MASSLEAWCAQLASCQHWPNLALKTNTTDRPRHLIVVFDHHADDGGLCVHNLCHGRGSCDITILFRYAIGLQRGRVAIILRHGGGADNAGVWHIGFDCAIVEFNLVDPLWIQIPQGTRCLAHRLD